MFVEDVQLKWLYWSSLELLIDHKFLLVQKSVVLLLSLFEWVWFQCGLNGVEGFQYIVPHCVNIIMHPDKRLLLFIILKPYNALWHSRMRSLKSTALNLQRHLRNHWSKWFCLWLVDWCTASDLWRKMIAFQLSLQSCDFCFQFLYCLHRAIGLSHYNDTQSLNSNWNWTLLLVI